jgi:pimeloyl-ACP methyl ester carboxylesterase
MRQFASSQPYLEHAPAWCSGYTAWLPEDIAPVRRVGYNLSSLERNRLIDPAAVEDFREATLLSNFTWRLLWADLDNRPDPESVAEAVRFAEAILVFVHGWDGSGEIWEDLPALAVSQNPRLIALVPDVNGFGGTPFRVDPPPVEKCNPPAIMDALQRWIDLIGVRSPQGADRVRPVVIIGHSMGGATLFFMDMERWRPREAGRIAAAPALLMNDRQRQSFYRTLGAGIQLTRLADLIDRISENIIAPRLIETLAGGGSERVLAEHERIYRSTPEGVIARTFAALGLLDARFEEPQWPDFLVYLGHRDVLVGLEPALELLADLNFDPASIRVALGDHYFFSIGKHADLHTKNRAMLLRDILAMARDLSPAE